MRLSTLLFVASISLAGCATSQTGADPEMVAAIQTAEPIAPIAHGPNVQEVLSDAFTAAGAYYGGRAEGYREWQNNHGNATVIVPGQETIFVSY